MTFATQTYSSRLMKAVAESLRQPLSIPLPAGNVINSLPAEDSPETDDVALQITYGRSPNLTIKQTCGVMSRKIAGAKKRERRPVLVASGKCHVRIAPKLVPRMRRDSA